MTDLDVDVLVIGWGKAGKTLAGVLGRSGRAVALVERSGAMHGGSCINVACVPTKALVHDSSAPADGVPPADRFRAAVGRRDTLVGRLREANHAMLAGVDAVTLVEGHARFIGPREVEVTGGADRLRISADAVVVNTGSAPARPPIPGVAESRRVHDSITVQHLDPLPRRLVVVGGGYVGLELAGTFAGFGSAVTLVDRNETFLPREDRDVAAAVREVLEGQGVEIVGGTEVTAVEDRGPDGAVTDVHVEGPRGWYAIETDAVLVATGRVPMTAGLDLDAAGIETDERGYVAVDDHLRTSVPGVWAVGDVNGGPQFTYVSLDDHRIVLDQITGAGRRSRADRVAVPTTTFLTPPFARVGLTEAQAREQGLDVLVASKAVADIAAMPRPKIVDDARGLIKVVVDAGTDQVLGAALLCVDAQELVNLVALAMRTGTTASQLRDGIWTHPSTTEALNEVLGELRPTRLEG